MAPIGSVKMMRIVLLMLAIAVSSFVAAASSSPPCDCSSDGLHLHTADSSSRSYCSCQGRSGQVRLCPENTFFSAKSQSCASLEGDGNLQESIQQLLTLRQRSGSGGGSTTHRTLRSSSHRRLHGSPRRRPFLLSVITREVFYELFKYGTNSSYCSQGSKIFQYDAFEAASYAYPRLGGQGRNHTKRREIAAFLAHISHETTGGWATAPGGPSAWGLCFNEELYCSEGGAGFGSEACIYCDNSSALYPCVPGKSYKGRGPIQLSWNYNYGLIGQKMGLGNDLLLNPELVATDGIISFKTAMQFWITPQFPKPSCHDVMIGNWRPSWTDQQKGRLPGFGLTTVIINGGLECGPPNAGNEREEDRVRYFRHFCEILGVDPGENLYCGTMTPYG